MVRKILLFILLILGSPQLALPQSSSLPEKISITDSAFSTYLGGNEYRYTLKLEGDRYEIIRTFQNEQGKLKKRRKRIGYQDTLTIRRFITAVLNDKTYELKYEHFSEIFTEQKAKDYIQSHGDTFWIEYDNQIDYCFDQLTTPSNVENNLEEYYKNYDRSGSTFGGSSTEILVSFKLNHKLVSVQTKSALEFGFPIRINKTNHFNPELSFLLAEIVPASDTNRRYKLSEANLFEHFARSTLSNSRKKLGHLESLNFQEETQELKRHFRVTNLRVVRGTYSINWSGEPRYACELWDSLYSEQLSIRYSSRIDSARMVFSPSEIISSYDTLVEKLLSIKFFDDFLKENSERKISIIYDDSDCFSAKIRDRFFETCNYEIDYTNSLLIALWNEDGNLSNWVILSDGTYLLWMEISGEAITPEKDENFIRCVKE